MSPDRRKLHPTWYRHVPSGIDILQDPALNKSTAFTKAEREAFHLAGLLPPRVFDLAAQEQRVLANFRGKSSDLDRYVFLQGLQDRNETLFYHTVLNNIEEIMPIIYTPTVGEACRKYAHIFRRPRGLYVSTEDRGRMSTVLRNWPIKRVGIIVVTDGERILGLGDLGANGMGIPVGKLSLYTTGSGIHPSLCLPITLDVGTNNEELLDDPLYLGLPNRRLRGDEYDSFIEEFVQAVEEVFPGVLLQFEDFAKQNAFALLERYRDRLCCFNDDIQGTASVALAGILSALRITGKPLLEQKVLFLGAGEAAIGIADLVTSALVRAGLSEGDARKRLWLMDSRGLVVEGREGLDKHKMRYAHHADSITDLATAIDTLEPTVLIGACAQPQTFTRPVIEAMARINERPIIFALSNPTSKAECTAEQAYEWSNGAAVYASGSPFAPVEFGGKTFVSGQGNNAYIFPGLGLGIIVCKASRVSDEMIYAAAETLAAQVDEGVLSTGCVYPPLSRIRDVSSAIAVAVVKIAQEQGLATLSLPENVEAMVDAQMYFPRYEDFV